MYSMSARFNKIFYFGMYSLLIVSFLNYLTGLALLKKSNLVTEFNIKDVTHFSNF